LWNSLKKGDQVVTAGGIHGTVVQVKDNEVVLEVAKDVRMTFSKTAIASKK
jgi:preprotein translocase subunit YajC